MKLFSIHFAFALLLMGLPLSAVAQKKKLYRIQLNSARDAHQFLKYTPGDFPVIAGHRGTVEDGFPENSIEGMEHVLEFTPAIFEIDPRLTKDSVIVLMHDTTLDRTTTGKGLISEHTFEELQQLFLKDVSGKPTGYKIPTLSAVMEWARGKTILNLDQKGVPYPMIADLIKKHKAEAFVMVSTHSGKHARYYFDQNPRQIFSAHIRTPAQVTEYEEAGIPFTQMIAYIGPHIKDSNQEMYKLHHSRGAIVMISAASTYDKLPLEADRKAKYLGVIRDGATVLETDYPIEAARAISELYPEKAPRRKFVKYR